jgi:hypothetical protein
MAMLIYMVAKDSRVPGCNLDSFTRYFPFEQIRIPCDLVQTYAWLPDRAPGSAIVEETVDLPSTFPGTQSPSFYGYIYLCKAGNCVRHTFISPVSPFDLLTPRSPFMSLVVFHKLYERSLILTS